MIGVFLDGQRLETSYGYEYTFNTIEEAKECCDKYGYMGYTYRDVEYGKTVDELVIEILNSMRG